MDLGSLAESAWIAIDPGPHTGIAIWHPDTDTFKFKTLDFTTAESTLTEDSQVAVWDWVEENVRDGDHLILEKFEYDRDKAQNAPHLDFLAAELVGVVKLWAYKNNADFCYQTRGAVGKSAFFNDDRLRALGLFKPGKDNRHEMDALRHLLYHHAFCCGHDLFLVR